MSASRLHLQSHYDAMWDRAWPAVSRGDVECDPHLTGGLDPRRGISLIARPAPALAARLADLQDRLADADPHQYRQPLSDLHMTVLRFVTPPADPARLAAALAALRDAPLGTMHVDTLELVVNDWYMSSAAVEPIERFALS
jgi:hypothetical protein